MSLKIDEVEIPSQTKRVAESAFAKGNRYLKLADELGVIFSDEDFKDLYPKGGRSAESPWRLALVTMLQFAEGLSDRDAAEAVRTRIDWKYLLALELEDDGFDFTVLTDFRSRLIGGNAEKLIFERLLSVIKQRGFVKELSQQRTDSTHVLALVQQMNQLELALETMHTTLNVLSAMDAEWVRSRIPVEWVEIYARGGVRLGYPKKENERRKLAERVGGDGYWLLDQLWQGPEWMREIPAVKTLRQIWLQNFYMEGEKIKIRDRDNQPPSSQRLISPHETEARVSKKSDTVWSGYKVQITETCEKDGPNIITNVQTEVATKRDQESVVEIHEELRRRGLLPKHQLMDTGYISAENIVKCDQIYGVSLIGPPQSDSSWQAREGKGFANEQFRVDWEAEQVTCPQGKKSVRWSESIDREKKVIRADFSARDCGPCTSREACTKADRRKIYMKPKEEYEAQQRARAEMQSDDFREQYKKRAGIEGTISQGVRAFGLRQCRYRGTAKTTLQHSITAAAININRVLAFLSGELKGSTRTPSFVHAYAA